jgi:hypothetical protein
LHCSESFSQLFEYEPAGRRIVYVSLFLMIALFILGIACINFMNITTAQAYPYSRLAGGVSAKSGGFS